MKLYFSLGSWGGRACINIGVGIAVGERLEVPRTHKLWTGVAMAFGFAIFTVRLYIGKFYFDCE